MIGYDWTQDEGSGKKYIPKEKKIRKGKERGKREEMIGPLSETFGHFYWYIRSTLAIMIGLKRNFSNFKPNLEVKPSQLEF